MRPVLPAAARDAGVEWYENYRELRNDFAAQQVCQIEIGEKIDEACKRLGNPVEFPNYNFGNVCSAQYRNARRGYFVEIIYTQSDGAVIGVFWGRGRTQTLAHSGACANFR